MQKERKDKSFLKKPIYEGGPKAMKAFISSNLNYPQDALKQKIEGTVIVQYDIDYRGKVIDAKVRSGVGYGCDEEAIRLVKLLQFTVPKNRGVKVIFHKTVQIHFRLPKQKAPSQPTKTANFSYNYIPKSKPKAPKASPKKIYTYTIGVQ